MKKLNLIIMDFQYDLYHCIGARTMKVKDGYEKLLHINSFIHRTSDSIHKIWLTRLLHPKDWVNFQDNASLYDGVPEKYCVQDSWGATFSNDIIECIQENELPYEMIDRGRDKPFLTDLSEFRDGVPHEFYQFPTIVCGIGGDKALLKSLQHLHNQNVRDLTVYPDGIAFFKDCRPFYEYVFDHQIGIAK